jgi:hypothetical protein
MTPTATTPAARGKRKTSRATADGHRTPLRRSTAPPAPRRVSGPVRPAQTASAAGPAQTANPARTARAAGTAALPRGRRQAPVRPSLAARSVGSVRALPDHALLDRIIRGRAWIPLLGVLLAGIVAMQVEVLKLNAAIGRGLEQGTTLQTANDQLRAAVARASDVQRIESMAAKMGMVMPAPSAVRLVRGDGSSTVAHAVAGIHAPNAPSFQAALAAASGDTTGSASGD